MRPSLHPITLDAAARRFVRIVILASSGVGMFGGITIGWLAGLGAMTCVLAGIGAGSLSAFICAAVLTEMFRKQCGILSHPSIPDSETRMRFSKVFGVHLLRKNQKKQIINIVDTLAVLPENLPYHADEGEGFQTATIVYENMGRYSSSDTFTRDEALANAKIALLSMDHTKQIPH